MHLYSINNQPVLRKRKALNKVSRAGPRLRLRRHFEIFLSAFSLNEKPGNKSGEYIASGRVPHPWCKCLFSFQQIDDSEHGSGEDDGGAPQAESSGEGVSEAGHIENDLRCGDRCKYHAFRHNSHTKASEKFPVM